MFCNKCGQKLAPNSEFCHKCGASVVCEDIDENNNTKNELREKVDANNKNQPKSKSKRTKKVVLSIVLSIVSLALVAAILVTVVIPQVNYSIACNHLKNKNYASAITLFEDLGDYKDSAQKLLETKYAKASSYLEKKQYKEAYSGFKEVIGYSDSEVKADAANKGLMTIIKNAKKGEVVTFGFYNDAPVDWYVLKKEKGQIMLFSCESIGDHAFNDYLSSATWENCSLRDWLNKTFINSAFDSNDQKYLVSKNISNTVGNNTTDKVFLLSQIEIEKYCTEKMAYGTSLGREFFLRDQQTYSVWDKMFYPARRSTSQNEKHSIRPAIWVDISKIK